MLGPLSFIGNILLRIYRHYDTLPQKVERENSRNQSMSNRADNIVRRLALPVLLLFFIAMTAQTARYVVHLGVDEGLSQGSAFGMVQDEKGFIWIATADGLNRYDGKNFEVFEHTTSDSAAYPFTRLRNLFCTKGAVWVTTSQNMELFRFDLITKKVKRVFVFSDHKGLGEMCPFLLDHDTLWMLASGEGVVAVNTVNGEIVRQHKDAINSFPVQGLCRYDSVANVLWYISSSYKEFISVSIATGETIRRAIMYPGTSDTLAVYSISDCNGDDPRIYMGSGKGIVSFDPATGATSYFRSRKETEADQPITALLAYGENTVWCGTTDGIIYHLDPQTGTYSVRYDPSPIANAAPHRIMTFLMDRSENLWAGSDPSGLFRIDTKQKPFNHTYVGMNETEGLRTNFMKCFLFTADEMFIGTHDQGVNVMNRKSGSYRYIQGFDATLPVICKMVADSSGRVWCGTAAGLGVVEPGADKLTYPAWENSSSLKFTTVKTIYNLRDGRMVCGTYLGPFIVTKKGDKYAVDSLDVQLNVECFSYDSKGNLWMGAAEGIYCSQDGDPKNLEQIVTNVGLVKTLHEYNGFIWAGTDRGLQKLDPAAGTIVKTFTEADGLSNSFVYGILSDASGHLWMSTNKGISRFDPQTETFRNYSVTDGLQSNEFNTGAFARTEDGELYFGGVNGYNHFYPEKITDNPYTPVCVMTGFKIFDKPWALDSAIEYQQHILLDYTNNNLLLEYAGIEYSDPDRNRFRYRLLGLDSNWIEAGDAHFARFVNLDPGEYTFQVKAANNDGVWNNVPTELRITITPPFWATTTFIICVSVISLLLIVVSVRLYFRRQLRLRTRELQLRQSARVGAIIETEEKERKRIAEELHDGLGQLLSTARLNISGIGSDLQQKDAVLWKNSLDLLDEACSEVRTISHNMMPGALIRAGLIEAIDDLVSKINDSGLIKIDFETELNERFPEATEVGLYRITQEILNNMIKHAEASRIVITLMKSGNELQLTIADNGKSFDVSAIRESDGIGWKNIHSRLDVLKGTIHISSEKSKGTSVYLNVPLN